MDFISAEAISKWSSPSRSYRMADRWATSFASSKVTVSTPSWMRLAVIRSSTALSALRTSPPQQAAKCSRTPSSQDASTSSSWACKAIPLSTAGRISSAVSILNSKTVERDRMALNMVKYGFSVVEAISVIFPFSMNSSKDCCCFLLKY